MSKNKTHKVLMEGNTVQLDFECTRCKSSHFYYISRFANGQDNNMSARVKCKECGKEYWLDLNFEGYNDV